MCFCSTLVLFREMRPSVHPFLTLARARRTASAPRDLLDLWYRNSLHHPLICLHFLFLCVSSPDKAAFSEDRNISEMMMIKPDRSLLQWPYSFTFVLKHTEDGFFNLWKEHLRMRQVAHVKKKKKWAWGKVSKDKCLSEKRQYRRLEERSGICGLGNLTKPMQGFRWLWGFRGFGTCSCCYTHSDFWLLTFLGKPGHQRTSRRQRRSWQACKLNLTSL